MPPVMMVVVMVDASASHWRSGCSALASLGYPLAPYGSLGPHYVRRLFPLFALLSPGITSHLRGRQSVLSAACKGCCGSAMPPTTIDELLRTIPIVAPHN